MRDIGDRSRRPQCQPDLGQGLGRGERAAADLLEPAHPVKQRVGWMCSARAARWVCRSCSSQTRTEVTRSPAHAPGTGTPEAGGLTSRELLGILRGLAGLPLIGADVVEVAPAYDHAEITSVAAAHVCFELLALMLLGTR